MKPVEIPEKNGLSIGIIIPVLDEAANIESVLRSLQAHRVGGAEIVVVDGGSGDRTVSLARPHADQVLTAPRGRGAQMNAGASACGADLLIFLHADTQLPEGAINHVRQALVRGACWGRFDVTLAGSLAGLGLVGFMMNWRSRLTGIATGDQGMFMTRAAFDAVGGFPDIPLMEDLVISKRLRALKWPACLHARVVTSGRRWERHGLWRTIWAMWRLRLRFFLGADPAALARDYGYTPREP